MRYANVNNLTPQLDQGVTGLFTPESSNDPGIKPETNTEIETGFDATLFQSRAQFSATVYQKRITDLLLQASIPASSGNTSQWLNGGQFTDRGIELSLSVTPIQMPKGLTWIFNTTFYRNYSVMDELPVPAFSPATSFGPAFGQYWEQVGRSLTEFVNTNNSCGNGCYQQDGDVAPSYRMSFGNTFTLSRFHLYGLVDWQRGGNTGNLTNAYYDPNGLFLLADTAAEVKRNAVNAAGGPRTWSRHCSSSCVRSPSATRCPTGGSVQCRGCGSRARGYRSRDGICGAASRTLVSIRRSATSARRTLAEDRT